VTRNSPLGCALIVAALTAFVSSDGSAQAELRGRVVSDSGSPIPNATITLTGLRYSVRSDSLGVFRLSGTPGSTLNLSLSATGFRDDSATVILPRGRALARDFVMVSEATFVPEANPSSEVVRGRVILADGSPIAYANVQLNGGRRFVTDDSGRFTIPVNTSGGFSLLVRRIGFSPEELKLSNRPDTAVRILMKAVAHALPTQLVTTRSPFVSLDLGGFYSRMKEVQNGARVGYFVTPEDFEMRNPISVTDAVEQFPSIRLRPIKGEYRTPLPLARRMRIEDRNGCPLTVYLNRVRIQPTIVRGEAMDEPINELIQPNSVAGIEVYPRATGAPAEYPAVGCGQAGVVLIWTK
jgi:hypothetical protein